MYLKITNNKQVKEAYFELTLCHQTQDGVRLGGRPVVARLEGAVQLHHVQGVRDTVG